MAQWASRFRFYRMIYSDRSASQKRGFTIIELLIVVVVIAILAAITIVAFNGVTQRAQDTRQAAIQAEIATKLELFKVKNNRYPTIPDSSGAATELETLLRDAGIYDDTRRNLETNTSMLDIIFCQSPDQKTFITVISPKPVGPDSFTATDGMQFYYVHNGSKGKAVYVNDTSMVGVGSRFCKSVDASYDESTWHGRWAFDVPTVKAQ